MTGFLSQFRLQATTAPDASPSSPSSPFRTPTRVTPARGLIRPRTDSVEARETEVKRLKTHAEDVCKRNGLSEGALENFSTVS